jgi:hypothetical protein
MGTCIYCGKPAGIFRKKHRECAEKRNQGWNELIRIAIEAAIGTYPLEDVNSRSAAIAENSFLSSSEIREALVAGWEKAVEHFLEDGNLDPQEETRLVAFAEHFELSQEDLDKNGAYTQFVKGLVLRDLMEGKIPERFRPIGQLPFNFQRKEKLIWAFNDVMYYEDRTRRRYTGGSRGVSIRIAKGVYYRVGSFRGHPIETTERIHVDTGILAVTTKHLYFYGPRKSFRIRFDKIVSFTPYSDGIGIQRDAATAKPQIFVTGDGWFTYNLLVNLSNLEN